MAFSARPNWLEALCIMFCPSAVRERKSLDAKYYSWLEFTETLNKNHCIIDILRENCSFDKDSFENCPCDACDQYWTSKNGVTQFSYSELCLLNNGTFPPRDDVFGEADIFFLTYGSYPFQKAVRARSLGGLSDVWT